jgi:hypothetical protein
MSSSNERARSQTARDSFLGRNLWHGRARDARRCSRLARLYRACLSARSEAGHCFGGRASAKSVSSYQRASAIALNNDTPRKNISPAVCVAQAGNGGGGRAAQRDSSLPRPSAASDGTPGALDVALGIQLRAGHCASVRVRSELRLSAERAGPLKALENKKSDYRPEMTSRVAARAGH